MSSDQGSGTNPSTLLRAQSGQRLRRSRRSSEAPGSHLSRRWRATVTQKVYSFKLYNALRRSRRSTTVRDTADKMLAATARGATRWSRAILVSRVRTSLHRRKNTKPSSEVRGDGGRMKLSAVGSRVRVLGGLVPGCRRTALSELLDETEDYIAALEMQVRAMTAISKILSEFQSSDKLRSAL
ncbi:Transcription factor bHLH150 [Raphanus sativus]|uniref:Transcription factor bHLH150-like n=1 Tax=Raphanus sativus TaxID=3726 RepID=A0A6J0NWR6_RAPSA|nr:transcription factor bHLH150-like [Raphanus sativus]KAJ4898465.1 Transcription factor bHLH150 [Raphanus sativus]